MSFFTIFVWQYYFMQIRIQDKAETAPQII